MTEIAEKEMATVKLARFECHGRTALKVAHSDWSIDAPGARPPAASQP